MNFVLALKYCQNVKIRLVIMTTWLDAMPDISKCNMVVTVNIAMLPCLHNTVIITCVLYNYQLTKARTSLSLQLKLNI